MSCTANSKYGIKELSTIFDSGMLLPYLWQRGVLAKELSTIFDSGMLLPYLWQRGVLAIVDSLLDHGQNTSMANC